MIPSVSQRADEPFLPMFFAADVESDWKIGSPIRFKGEFKGNISIYESPFQTAQKAKKPEPVRVRTLHWETVLNYFRAGGKSVQLPCATSAAMPMDSPSVGCG